MTTDDIGAYRKALLEAGVAIELPTHATNVKGRKRALKDVDRDLAQLAEGGYDKSAARPPYRAHVSPGYKEWTGAAPPDVAFAIKHGLFKKDDGNPILVLPPGDELLGRVSEWANVASRWIDAPGLKPALDAVTRGLSLGDSAPGRLWSRDGERRSGATRRLPWAHDDGTAEGCEGDAFVFELRIPEPESHGLPGPCFLRCVRCKTCGVVRDIQVLRGTHDQQSFPEAKPVKGSEITPSRILVPGRGKKPRGWIGFDAWCGPKDGACASPGWDRQCVWSVQWE